MTAAQIDYLFFDLDDTLVDHRAAATAAFGYAIDRWSPDSSASDFNVLLSLWQQLEREEYDNYLRGECTHAEQRVRRLGRFLPTLGAASGDDAFLTAQFQHYLDAYIEAWSPFPTCRHRSTSSRLPASALPSSRTANHVSSA